MGSLLDDGSRTMIAWIKEGKGYVRPISCDQIVSFSAILKAGRKKYFRITISIIRVRFFDSQKGLNFYSIVRNSLLDAYGNISDTYK